MTLGARARLHDLLDRPVLHRMAAAVPPMRAVARRLATRRDGSLALASGPVHWEGLDFEFTAPLKTHRSARRRGIENIVCRIVRHAAGPGATVADIGASYGFVTLVAAQAVGPSGRVISAECDPEVAEVLAENLTANSVDDRVLVIPRAVGGPGTATTLTHLAAGEDQRLDVVKIDTDGSDLAVLLGGAEVIERHRPVLVVEMTEDPEAILTWLRARYPVVLDQFGGEPDGPPWPENAIAAPKHFAWLTDVWMPPRSA